MVAGQYRQERSHHHSLKEQLRPGAEISVPRSTVKFAEDCEVWSRDGSSVKKSVHHLPSLEDSLMFFCFGVGKSVYVDFWWFMAMAMGMDTSRTHQGPRPNWRTTRCGQNSALWDLGWTSGQVHLATTTWQKSRRSAWDESEKGKNQDESTYLWSPSQWETD